MVSNVCRFSPAATNGDLIPSNVGLGRHLGENSSRLPCRPLQRRLNRKWRAEKVERKRRVSRQFFSLPTSNPRGLYPLSALRVLFLSPLSSAGRSTSHFAPTGKRRFSSTFCKDWSAARCGPKGRNLVPVGSPPLDCSLQIPSIHSLPPRGGSAHFLLPHKMVSRLKMGGVPGEGLVKWGNWTGGLSLFTNEELCPPLITCGLELDRSAI